MKRLLALLLPLVLLASALPASAASKATSTPPPVELEETFTEEIPPEIRKLLDVAQNELEETAGKNLKRKNKYTAWYNAYEWEWCAGFVTWCLMEAGIPQEDYRTIEPGEKAGLYHATASAPGKMVTGYSRMYRTTMIPRKGFIVVYGSKNYGKFWHVGFVYDVEKLDNGRYRLTTIEGNVNNHSVCMFVRDYDPHPAKSTANFFQVPKDERFQEESKTFSYKFTYNDKTQYVTMFLMPWVPGDEALEMAAPATEVPAGTPAPV